MDKPTKPTDLIPRSFGGVKNNFSPSLQTSGYEDGVPAIYGGDNLNYQLDATGKELDYCEKIVDFVNELPIGKTITTDANNKLIYVDFDVENKANKDLSNLSATGQAVIDGQWISVSETLLSNGTISPDTEYTYILSFLPNDGSIYEVIGYMEGHTLPTSGKYFTFFGYSSFMRNGLLKSVTRTSTSNIAMGSFNFIIGSDRKFWFKDTGDGATGVILDIRAYRRIGTNQ